MGELSSAAAVIFLTGDFTRGALALNKEQQICGLLGVNFDSLARVDALIRVESPLAMIEGLNIFSPLLADGVILRLLAVGFVWLLLDLFLLGGEK